jgi:hypothetical protein
VLTFDETTHTYRVDGRVVPSVTQILSRVGVKGIDGRWHSISGSENYELGHPETARGKEIHAAIALRLRGIPEEHDPAIDPWLAAWEGFMRKDPLSMWGGDYKRIVAEMATTGWNVETPKHSGVGYAGTPDFQVFTSPNVVTIDWKTTNESTAVMRHWWLQTAAYGKRDRRYNDSSLIVVLTPIGFHFEIHDTFYTQNDYNQFLSVLNIYRMMKGSQE